MRRLGLLFAVLTLTLCSTLARGDEADRQKLVALFKNVQDVLLTINSEIIQYGERLQDVATRIHDNPAWQAPALDEQRLTPQIKELNRLKMAVSLIGSGLEAKYTQLKTFQRELKERYPEFTMEIEYYYNLFEKVFEDSRERHRRIVRQMDELKTWFRNTVASRVARRGESDDEDEKPGANSRRRRFYEHGSPPSVTGTIAAEGRSRSRDREIGGKLERGNGAIAVGQ